ncbi:MAG: lamin tail domain-containing protein, partial [Candidatus Thermoplasmatota archaeon]|nr:lamin tail domain-containing protein [Candidatus Thermoplasmatota archaeon]
GKLYDSISPKLRWIDCETKFNVSTPVDGPDSPRNIKYICDDNESHSSSNNLTVEFLFHAEFSLDVVIDGSSQGERFGHSVSGGGDFGGDGNSDIMVGAPMNDSSSQQDRGSIYIDYDSSSWSVDSQIFMDSNDASTIYTGDNEGDKFGFSVALGGYDLNGGSIDILCGAPNWTRPPHDNDKDGRVYIFSRGGDWPDVTITWDRWNNASASWDRDVLSWSKSGMDQKGWYNFTLGADPVIDLNSGDTLLMNISVGGGSGSYVDIYLDSEKYPSHYQIRGLLKDGYKTISSASTEWTRTAWQDSGKYSEDWVAEYSKNGNSSVQINSEVIAPPPLDTNQINETINVSLYRSDGTLIKENVTMERNQTHSMTDHLVISEVYYDLEVSGENYGEYVEIFNPTSSEVNLKGWTLDDGEEKDTISGSDLFIPSYSYLTICDDEFEGFTKDPDVTLSDIGNGLANGGDHIKLNNSAGDKIDEVGWEGERGWSLEAEEGHVLRRLDRYMDNNNEREWSTTGSPYPQVVADGRFGPAALFTHKFDLSNLEAGKTYMAVVTAIDNDKFDEWGIGWTTPRTVKFEVKA